MKSPFGATGDYPEGKLNEDDQGGLMMGVAYDQKKDVVVINFGTPVTWIALPPEQADKLARMILAKVREAL